jgi:hypothetical protein
MSLSQRGSGLPCRPSVMVSLPHFASPPVRTMRILVYNLVTVGPIEVGRNVSETGYTLLRVCGVTAVRAPACSWEEDCQARHVIGRRWSCVSRLVSKVKSMTRYVDGFDQRPWSVAVCEPSMHR